MWDFQNMAIKTERSLLIEKPEKIPRDEYCLLKEAGDEEGAFKAEDPLLGDASQDYVPNGGWGWIVTLSAFVIWVR